MSLLYPSASGRLSHRAIPFHPRPRSSLPGGVALGVVSLILLAPTGNGPASVHAQGWGPSRTPIHSPAAVRPATWLQETLPPGTKVIAPAAPEQVRPEGRPGASPAGLGDEPSRLELLPRPGLPATPHPNGEVQRTYQRFVQQTIDPENTLDLIVGRPRILVFADTPKRLFLPNEDIASYQVISDTEISVVGHQQGRTVLNIWVPDADAPRGERILSYLVNVHAEPQYKDRLEAQYRELERELNRAFPRSRVELSLIGDRLVVRGQAKDAIEAAQILSVLVQSRGQRRNSTNRDATRTNDFLLDRSEISEEEQEGVRRSVLDVSELSRSNIVNMLEVPGEQQVVLRVTVAEVNRIAARSIGLNFDITNNAGDSVFRSITGSLASGGLSNMVASLDNGQVVLALHALRTLKLSKTLAEPNLTALNGRTARFQAGGQFPVPIIGGFTNNGLQGVGFVPFGVQLQFTPFVMDRQRIRLQVVADVSTRDEALGANIGGAAAAGGTNVAGLNTRNFATTVELRTGQTLAVAGLLQSNFGSDADRVPFWGDLPFIGHTGGYSRTSAGEQELVILITPELVHPLEACVTPGLPGDDIYEPTDVEFFLKNRLESRRSRNYRSPVRTDYARIRAGDKYCEDQFILGPIGPTYGCCRPTDGPAPIVTGPLK